VKIPLFQVDVFADRLFGGNPAAVCPLEQWLPDATLQAIGAENNLPETAFFVREAHADSDFHLRWFTPTVEVDLCGHATLASGWVLLERLGWTAPRVRFRTRSGVLSVERSGEALWLDLPSRPPAPLASPPVGLMRGLRTMPLHWLVAGTNYFAVYGSEAEITALAPDFAALATLVGKGVVVTAPASRAGIDFVSRFFAPGIGIPEDPATGAAHCLLVPYWAARLGRARLEAVQLSARVGRLQCELAGERVRLSGPVAPYLRGEIELP